MAPLSSCHPMDGRGVRISHRLQLPEVSSAKSWSICTLEIWLNINYICISCCQMWEIHAIQCSQTANVNTNDKFTTWQLLQHCGPAWASCLQQACSTNSVSRGVRMSHRSQLSGSNNKGCHAIPKGKIRVHFHFLPFVHPTDVTHTSRVTHINAQSSKCIYICTTGYTCVPKLDIKHIVKRTDWLNSWLDENCIHNCGNTDLKKLAYFVAL